jgi:hypothetical protein
MSFKVSTNAASLAKTLERIPTRLERELYPTLNRWGREHIARMGQRMRAGGTADSVKTRTGLLRGSFQHEVRRGGGLGNLRLRVFSAGVKYADIQERGGIVRPTKAKFLAIPQPAVKTASGVARYASPRSYPGETFVFRSKKGGLWVAEKKGKRGKVVLLWHLVKSVRIKGRLGWFDTWRSGSAQRRDQLKAAATRALEGAGQA